MSGGYTASTDAMATASKKITQLAQDLPDKNTDLPSSPVNAQGFGQAHGDHATKYTTGVQTLWAAISGYSNTLNTYGTNIGTGGKAYAEGDHAQSNTVSKAGSQ
jgi:exo-beta-1,3-glucanase (GH17 family)